MKFGDVLRELRNGRQLTQLQLSEILETSKSNISKYEAGSVEPSLETLVKIADYFGVSMDSLLCRSDRGIDYSNYVMDRPEFGFEFKSKIRELISEQGLSENEFARIAGFSRDEKDAYLFENRIPSVEDLIKISGALGVSAYYLLGMTDKKNLSSEETELLRLFNCCDDECKKYLIAKAGVLCVEGISAVAAGEYGKYADDEKKSFPSSGTEGKGA